MRNETCFLLSYIKYGDHDAILQCFSKESGYQSFFLRGIYSPKNKKKAYLSPLNLLQITLLQSKNNSSLQTISKIEKAGVFYDFNEVKSSTILFFVSDFLQQILKNEANHSKIFQEIETFTLELYKGNFSSYIALIFKMLLYQGISPLVEDRSFLDAETGNFTDIQTHSIFDKQVSSVWKNYLQENNAYNIILNRKIRNQILESLILYYRIHFDGFYEPHSLAIIKEIFE